MAIRETALPTRHSARPSWTPQRSGWLVSDETRTQAIVPDIDFPNIPKWYDELSKIPNHNAVEAAIEASRKILALQDNWDDEGSLGYSDATWQRAVDFLVLNITCLWENHSVSITAPTIGPGPDGSIDLYWKANSYQLLVNIPLKIDELATFSGKKQSGPVVRGAFDSTADNSDLLVWLLK